MSTQPSVIVNKRSGFFTALVQGFFMMVVTALICVTLLASIAMLVFNQRSSDIFSFGNNIINKLERWPAIVPPIVADMFQTERSVEYLEAIEIEVERIPTGDGHAMLMIEVQNKGDEVISWLTVHAVAFEGDGLPIGEKALNLVTPFTFPTDQHADMEDVRGPLLPGSTRKIPIVDEDLPYDVEVELEITDLRIWRKSTSERSEATAVAPIHEPEVIEIIAPVAPVVPVAPLAPDNPFAPDSPPVTSPPSDEQVRF